MSAVLNGLSRAGKSPAEESAAEKPPADESLESAIQRVLDGYRPTLYIDGGDVELQHVDDDGVAHIKMLGACIDCPISLLTMKLGIQRLLKENFPQITGINAITDIDISALYEQRRQGEAALASVQFSSRKDE